MENEGTDFGEKNKEVTASSTKRPNKMKKGFSERLERARRVNRRKTKRGDIW